MNLTHKEWFNFYCKSGSIFKKHRDEVQHITDDVDPIYLHNVRLLCTILSVAIPVGISDLLSLTVFFKYPLFVLIAFIILAIGAGYGFARMAAHLLYRKYSKKQ